MNSVRSLRQGSAEEVANVIAFLLGPDSTFVSGSVYAVDGAWTWKWERCALTRAGISRFRFRERADVGIVETVEAER